MNSTTVITLYAPQVTSTNALGKLSCVNDINKHQKYVLPFIWKKNKEIEPRNLKKIYWMNYDWMNKEWRDSITSENVWLSKEKRIAWYLV